MRVHITRWPWILIMCTLLHFIQGVLIAVHAAALKSPALDAVEFLGGHAAWILIALAIVASVGIAINQRKYAFVGVLCLMPQQTLLVMTAGTTIQLIASTPHDALVIAADQIVYALLALIHFIAVLDLFGADRLWKEKSERRYLARRNDDRWNDDN